MDRVERSGSAYILLCFKAHVYSPTKVYIFKDKSSVMKCKNNIVNGYNGWNLYTRINILVTNNANAAQQKSHENRTAYISDKIQTIKKPKNSVAMHNFHHPRLILVGFGESENRNKIKYHSVNTQDDIKNKKTER